MPGSDPELLTPSFFLPRLLLPRAQHVCRCLASEMTEHPARDQPLSPGIGSAIDRKEESRPESCPVTKDRGEVEHGDTALGQGGLQGMLESRHRVTQ